jgi:hypothetical protein
MNKSLRVLGVRSSDSMQFDILWHLQVRGRSGCQVGALSAAAPDISPYTFQMEPFEFGEALFYNNNSLRTWTQFRGGATYTVTDANQLATFSSSLWAEATLYKTGAAPSANSGGYLDRYRVGVTDNILRAVQIEVPQVRNYYSVSQPMSPDIPEAELKNAIRSVIDQFPCQTMLEQQAPFQCYRTAHNSPFTIATSALSLIGLVTTMFSYAYVYALERWLMD